MSAIAPQPADLIARRKAELHTMIDSLQTLDEVNAFVASAIKIINKPQPVVADMLGQPDANSDRKKRLSRVADIVTERFEQLGYTAEDFEALLNDPNQ